MKKTKEELAEYAVMMKKRGDSYVDISRYLKNQLVDEEGEKEILAYLSKLEQLGELKPDDTQQKTTSTTGLIFGILFIIAGIGLAIFLLNKGFIASLSLILIVLGILGIKGAIK